MKKRLSAFSHKFEHFTNKIIPYLLIGLGIVLILENPFWTLVHLEQFEPWITIFDGFIVFFFVVDLIYKWYHTRKVRKFLKLYWLDVVAVFPFYLGIRAYTEIRGIILVGEEIAEAQKLAHEAVLVREARVLEEARLARETKPLTRAVRAGQRFLRALKGRLYATHRSLMQVHPRGGKD